MAVLVCAGVYHVAVDPLTQGLIGAAASQAVFGRRLPRSAWLIGLVGGVTADADFVARYFVSPLEALAFHRHLTHSLLFIPIGALIAALPFLLLRPFKGQRKAVYGAALVAYATHAPLDACTAYGTVLFYPITDARIAFDLIGIIDPVFTLALAIGLMLGVARRRIQPTRYALAFCVLYLSVGGIQNWRVTQLQETLAEGRGHAVARGRAMPMPGTLWLWRSVYHGDDGYIYADEFRVPPLWLGEVTANLGRRVKPLTPERLENDLRERGYGDTQVTEALDAFETFDWFTDGYSAWDERNERVIGDMRYATRPDVFTSMWGLHIAEPAGGADETAHFGRTMNGMNDRVGRLWQALRGEDEAFLPMHEILPRSGKVDAGE